MRFILLVWHSFSLFLTLSLFHFSSFSVLFCFFCCRLPPTHSLSSSPSPLSLLPTSSCRHLLPFSSVFFFILFYILTGTSTLSCPFAVPGIRYFLASHVLSCLYCYPSLPPTNSSLSLKQIIKNPSAVFNRSGRASSNLQ